MTNLYTGMATTMYSRSSYAATPESLPQSYNLMIKATNRTTTRPLPQILVIIWDWNFQTRYHAKTAPEGTLSEKDSQHPDTYTIFASFSAISSW